MYFFRADGNAVTGAGHLMRCLTIARELLQLFKDGDQICFLCADASSADLVSQRGFQVRVLKTDHLHMEEELPVLAELLGDSGDHVILVDSYHVTEAYLKGLRAFGRVYLMDDMGRKPYPVDGVINYNAFAQKAHYESLYQGQKVQLAIGSSFVPVRRQFLQVPYTVREQVREVLITTGGGDNDNIAAAVLDAIKRPQCCYHVIIGRFNRHFSQWKQLAQESDCIQVHYDVTDMAALMKQCDLAVTAGGTTIYELAAVGVPFLCFSYAENQEALTAYIGREQIAGYCGAYHMKPKETLENMSRLSGLLGAGVGTPEEIDAGMKLRRKMYRREREMTDGLGAGRIARLLADGQEGAHG